MFHALVGRFQLELFIFITYFSTVVPITSCVFFPVGFSSLTRHFQQILWFLLSPDLGSWHLEFSCWKCHVNDKRATGKKRQFVSGATVEKYVIKTNNSTWSKAKISSGLVFPGSCLKLSVMRDIFSGIYFCGEVTACGLFLFSQKNPKSENMYEHISFLAENYLPQYQVTEEVSRISKRSVWQFKIFTTAYKLERNLTKKKLYK